MIFDQNMGHAITWTNIEKVRRDVDVTEVKIFLLDCPFEVCLERAGARLHHPNLTEMSDETLRDHKYKWDFLDENDFPNAIRIDATKPQGVVLREVLGYLGYRDPPDC